MLLVVLVHANFGWQGWPASVDVIYKPALLVEALAAIGVNVFVLISGYFSVKPKLKSLTNLLFICLFYAIVRLVVGLGTGHIDWKEALFISRSNWFIVSYLGLMFLAPVIDTYINKISKQQFIVFIAILLLFDIYWGWLPKQCMVEPGFKSGYSIISFVVIYVIGRYLKKYGEPSVITQYSLAIYLICSVIIALMAYAQLYFLPNWNLWEVAYAYNNPFLMLSSISFFVFFKNLKMKESKIVNLFAASSLSVLLLHTSGATNFWMKSYFCGVYDSYKGISLYGLWVVGLILIYLVCTLIDQARIFSYKCLSKRLYNTAWYIKIDKWLSSTFPSFEFN